MIFLKINKNIYGKYNYYSLNKLFLHVNDYKFLNLKKQKYLLNLFNRAHLKQIKKLFNLPEYKLLQITRFKKENKKLFTTINDLETYGILSSNQIINYLKDDIDSVMKNDALLNLNDELLNKYKKIILFDVSNKNTISCIYNVEKNKIEIIKLFSIDYKDSFLEIINIMMESILKLEEADLYILNDKFKNIYQTKQMDFNKIVLKNNAIFGICLQRYLSKLLKEEEIVNNFESINMNIIYQPYLNNFIDLLKDMTYVKNLKEKSLSKFKETYENLLQKETQQNLLDIENDIKFIQEIAFNGINYISNLKSNLYPTNHNVILLYWSIIDKEGAKLFIQSNIFVKYPKLFKLIDKVNSFEFTTNTLKNYFNDKTINQTQSILYNIAITYILKTENI